MLSGDFRGKKSELKTQATCTSIILEMGIRKLGDQSCADGYACVQVTTWNST